MERICGTAYGGQTTVLRPFSHAVLTAWMLNGDGKSQCMREEWTSLSPRFAREENALRDHTLATLRLV